MRQFVEALAEQFVDMLSERGIIDRDGFRAAPVYQLIAERVHLVAKAKQLDEAGALA